MSFTSRTFLAAALLALPLALRAAPGALDTTFNGTGEVLTVGAHNEQTNAVAIQPDGKVVTAGQSHNGSNYDFALARYNADGSLDTSFGTGGIVTTAMGNGYDGAFAVILQPDGKVLAAGSSVQGADTHFAIARYNTDGSLDTGFDTDGIVTTPVGTVGEAYAIALQRDGKIVIAGFTTPDGAVYKFALLRYDADGSLDTGFGSGGVVTTAIGTVNDEVNAIALQPDGKVVAAGFSENGLNRDFALARYNVDGSLDASFGNGGIVTTSVGGMFYISATALQPDGKVVVAGTGGIGGFIAARYNADGSVDTSFGSGGMSVVGSPGSATTSIALQPDGKLLAAGLSLSGFNLLRYNTNGSLDTSFGSGGTAATAVSGGRAYAIALQPDGKVVAAGSHYNGTDDDFALARYIASDTPWDVTPDTLAFTDLSNVAAGSAQTSNTVTVAGLDTDAAVPLQVSGGSYSLNGGAYTDAMGWVRNGDTLTVQQTAASDPSTAVTTTLTVGGLVASNNTNVRLGDTVDATFTSTTAGVSSGDGSSGGGGGAFGLASLLLLGLGGALRRRPSFSA